MTSTATPATEYIDACPVGRIRVDDINPRTSITVDDDFVASIAAGILEPLIVRVDPATPQLTDTVGPVDFLLVAGHRRHLAAQQAGLDTVPVVVRHDLADDKAALVAMIVENGQREDLPPLDEARGIETLVGMGMSQRDVAKAVGREQSTVSKRLSLLKLPTRAQQLLESGRIGVKTAYGLTGLIKHNDRMSSVLDWAAQQGDADDALIAREVSAHLEAVAFEKDRAKRAKAGEPEPKPVPLDMKVDDRTNGNKPAPARPDAETYTDAVEAATDTVIADAAREYVAARLDNEEIERDAWEEGLARVDNAWHTLLAACGHVMETEDVSTVDEPAPRTTTPEPGDPCPYCLDGRVVFEGTEQGNADWRKATPDDLGTSPCPDCEGTGTLIDHDAVLAQAEANPANAAHALDDSEPDLPDLDEPWRGYETFGAARNIKVISGNGPFVTPDSLQAVIDYETARQPSRQKIIDAARARLEQLAEVNA